MISGAHMVLKLFPPTQAVQATYRAWRPGKRNPPWRPLIRQKGSWTNE